MPHKPSPQKFIRDYLLHNAFHDKEKAESINKNVTRTTLLQALQQHYEAPINQLLPEWLSNTCGEVLTDSRGNGYMQS